MSGHIKNWFSNFEPFDVPLYEDDITYKTVEHYFQAAKFNSWRKILVAYAKTPGYAKRLAHEMPIETPNWESLKLSVMEKALRWKFQPGSSWHTKLMKTGSEDIVEWNNWGDLFWGKDIKSKEGQNHLGKLLMKIRKEFQDGVGRPAPQADL